MTPGVRQELGAVEKRAPGATHLSLGLFGLMILSLHLTGEVIGPSPRS